MLKHIFTLLLNNWKPNVWLISGLFIISTCLWYAVDYVYAIGVNQRKTLGFDWHNVYNISIGALTQESPRYINEDEHTQNAGEDFRTFLQRLEYHPAVDAVCFTTYHKHYVWMNASTGLVRDTINSWSWIRHVSPDYFKVFQVKGANGETPEELAEKALIFTDVIITKDLADDLFPDINPIGQRVRVHSLNDSLNISAVCENQKYNEYTGYQRATYKMFNMNDLSGVSSQSVQWYGVYIRVNPAADNNDFIKTFRKDMRDQLKIGNLYLEDMRSVASTRKEHLKDYRNELYTHFAVAIFFLLNVFLAVLGTFWSRTQHRRPELGLRLALGSSKTEISTILFGEGLILLTIAFIPAAIVGYNLGNADVVSTWPVKFTVGRFFTGLAITYTLLALTVFIGVWFPARQAMKIDPAEVLHEE